MYCYKCGKVIPDDALLCPYCGADIKAPATAPTHVSASTASAAQAKAAQESLTPISPKSRLLTTLLCYFFGIIGVHRFYLGKVGSGIAMIFTIGGLGIWALIDLIMIVCGEFKDKDGLPIKNWDIN